MVTCWRKKAKSTLGRLADDAEGGLTGAGTGSTLDGAVVTTCSAEISALWPTALPLPVGAAVDGTGAAAAVDIGLSLGDSHGKWCSSKGRLVFQTAKTRCRSLRMQWPIATSPRLPLARRRRYKARTAGLWTMATRAAFHR